MPQGAVQGFDLTLDRTGVFGEMLHPKDRERDVQARNSHLSAVVAEFRIRDHEIQTIGDKAILATVIAGQQAAGVKANGRFRKWRTGQDENENGCVQRSI